MRNTFTRVILMTYRNFNTHRYMYMHTGSTENFRWKSDGSQPPSEVTRKFKLSNEQAPRLSEVRRDVRLPVINMAGEDKAVMAEQVANASKELGFFRVINHGVSDEVWLNAAKSVRDLFLLPPDIKSRFPGEEGPIDSVKVYSYFLNDWEDQRKVSMWSEVIYHLWHPTHDFTTAFPDDIPRSYREHVVAYAREMGVLMTRLMSLLSLGLGLDEGYLKRRLGDQPYYKCHGNYYPRCPDPNLTIGLPIHSDSLALTVVRTLGDVTDLQIRKTEGDNEDWIAVDELPNSFIVNIGDQLEVLSNGRYKSVLHRVVTNEYSSRLSLAYFWAPGFDEKIGPIEELVDEQHPRVYEEYVYKEFMEKHYNMEGKRRAAKDRFRINP